MLNLNPNESVIESLHHHWMIYGILIFIGLLILGIVGFQTLYSILILIVLVFIAIGYNKSNLVLTNQRILIRSGFIRKQHAESRLEKTESIAYGTSFFGGIFGYCDIVVYCSGSELYFKKAKRSDADRLIAHFNEIVQEREDSIKVRQAKSVVDKVVLDTADIIGERIGSKLSKSLQREDKKEMLDSGEESN